MSIWTQLLSIVSRCTVRSSLSFDNADHFSNQNTGRYRCKKCVLSQKKVTSQLCDVEAVTRYLTVFFLHGFHVFKAISLGPRGLSTGLLFQWSFFMPHIAAMFYFRIRVDKEILYDVYICKYVILIVCKMSTVLALGCYHEHKGIASVER